MLRHLPLLALLAAPTLAQDAPARSLRVVNDTSVAVNQLFVAGDKPGKLRAKVNGILGASEGERDRLENRMLARGGAIVVALKGERCRYDLRAVLADGRTYVAENYDVCANGTWMVGSGARK